MSDIFQEVDEDLARDKAERLWKRYQTPVFVAAFLVVAATGAWTWYDKERVKAAESANARYEAALALSRDGKHEDAAAAFDALKDAPRGYAALARLRAALERALADKGKAVEALEAVAEDKSVDKMTQQVAQLRAAFLAMEQGDREKMMRVLGPLMVSDGAFRYSAQEWTGLDALEGGDFDEAERVFDLISNDTQAPQSMRQRASAYKGLLQAARGPKKESESGAAAVTPVIESEDGKPVDAVTSVKEIKKDEK